MALAYLASWKGPVLDADDPYGDGVTDSLLKSVKHLQEARLFKTKDIGWIKSMILQYGSVESSLYMSVENSYLNFLSIDNDNYEENKRRVEKIFVMLDEKFVGSQFNNQKDHMI